MPALFIGRGLMPKAIFSYRKYWAECFGPAPELPMSRSEMDALGLSLIHISEPTRLC